VWDNFDRRQKAKSSAANEDEGLSAEASAQEEGDMFSRAGVAAE
jgi:hypothetical protein